MGNKRLRFGLVGLGSFGPELAKYLTEVADLVAVAEPDPRCRNRSVVGTAPDMARFADHREMLAQVDLDAVAITSPNFTHKEITIDAARAGKHVFCEKPMALTVADCWQMVRACEQAGVRLMVGHKRRLRPPWARMIELREELGDVMSVSSCLYFDGTATYSGWWTQESLCGGTLFAAGVHVIDWMRAMCGDVASVSARPGQQVSSRYDYPDTLHTSLLFQSGAVGSLDVSLSYPVLKFRESAGPLVLCREGGMRFVPYLDHIDLYWQRFDETDTHHQRFDDLGFDHAFSKEIGDFVRWIAEGTEPCLTWEQGLRCVEVMQAARLSAKQGGKAIALPLPLS